VTDGFSSDEISNDEVTEDAEDHTGLAPTTEDAEGQASSTINK
jgi:hypothetical protein